MPSACSVALRAPEWSASQRSTDQVSSYRARPPSRWLCTDLPIAGKSSPPLIGMSAPAPEWAQRTKAVGPGLTARRIFADLAGGATNQIKLVEQAHAAGQLPVISYKVGRDIAGAASGRYNAVAAQAAAKLASYDKPTAVIFWHEPHGDVSPAQYIAASKQVLPNFKRGKLRVGPLLNGFLLDRQQSTFASYAPNELFRIWDWFGIDTYESGTMKTPAPSSRRTGFRSWRAS